MKHGAQMLFKMFAEDFALNVVFQFLVLRYWSGERDLCDPQMPAPPSYIVVVVILTYRECLVDQTKSLSGSASCF